MTLRPPSPKRQVPITDLGLEYEAIKKDLTPLLDKILRSGAYVLGPELAQFEKELASYIGVRHAVGVNSGTDAVLLALRALDIKPGDEVILPAMSFFATVEPILLLGAKPIFVDIDPVSYAIDPAKISSKISARTKAIIAVHLYGLPADMKALSSIAKKNHIPLIEDMAQAIGSSFDGKKDWFLGRHRLLEFLSHKEFGSLRRCGRSADVIRRSGRARAKPAQSRREGEVPSR